MKLPWLHPQRADVLAALALAMRLRQPLASGFIRLSEGDPLLRPWAMRLSADLAGGAPLGAVLRRHRLLDRRSAARLDAARDPVGEFEHLSREQLIPLRGLLLLRWFPVALVAVILAPLALLQATGILSTFAQTYRELGIRLPAITETLISTLYGGSLSWVLAVAITGASLATLMSMRGLRHVCHLWWVDVHRQAALYELTCAAAAGDDAPRRLGWPGSWMAMMRISAWRQQRPSWDRAWRTWRILTRWRAFGPGWRVADRATTAIEVLIALGFLGPDPDAAAVLHLRTDARALVVEAVERARAQAHALLMIGIGSGTMVMVLALFLPLIRIVETLGGA